MARRSTTMADLPDGRQRLCHLVRGDDGLYTFVADPVPATRETRPYTDDEGKEAEEVVCVLPAIEAFSVDLTQSVMQAMRCEIRERSKLFATACQKAEGDRQEAGADPLTPEEVPHFGEIARLNSVVVQQQHAFNAALEGLRAQIAELRTGPAPTG